jgi:hypothetical protein
MSYIYHLKPIPFTGTTLIPLNMMDRESDLYKGHARKYVGREHLMAENIPILNCKWNDVVQFSAIDPQLIVDKLKTIQDNFILFRTEYFKIHVNQIIDLYDAVVFAPNPNKSKGNFKIDVNEIVNLTSSYNELLELPIETLRYWDNVKNTGGKYLWFPYVTHILIKGIIETKKFEICNLKI